MDNTIINNILFQDFLEQDPNKLSWITVGLVLGESERVIFSCLTKKDNIKRILEKSDWEVELGIGKHHFVQIQNKILLNPGVFVREDLIITPFTFYRLTEGKYNKIIEILQDFILYHDLRKDENGNYVNPSNEEVVIKCKNEPSIDINTSYLKDYLAATQSILIRYVDDYRKKSGALTEFFKLKEGETKVIREFKNEIRNFTIEVYNLTSGTFESQLYGKDIILPYPEPIHPDYLFLSGKEETKYEEFIVDLDETGKRIWEKCGPDYKLKLVFFRKEVLKKYYNNEDFEVEDGVIYKHNSWYIPYGINDLELVHVWLKDLKFIPYNEQSYWKGFNVLPDGGMGKTFFGRQMEAKFTESTDPVINLLSIVSNFKKKFKDKFGFDLFKELSNNDKYIEKQIHTLTLNQQSEFDQQISFLSKLIIETIDKEELKSHMKWRPIISDHDRSIFYFENFLLEKAIYDEPASKQICKPFRNLQSLRSESTAHRKSSDYSKRIKKLYNVDYLNYNQIFNATVQELGSSFKSLLLAIS